MGPLTDLDLSALWVVSIGVVLMVGGSIPDTRVCCSRPSLSMSKSGNTSTHVVSAFMLIFRPPNEQLGEMRLRNLFAYF